MPTRHALRETGGAANILTDKNEQAPAAALTPAACLQKALQNKTARIAIVGLGYVGLPMALAFSRAGFCVTGIDANGERCDALMQGKSYITDITDTELTPQLDANTFYATTKTLALAHADVILVCVPTPLRKSKDPDLTAIIAAGQAVAAHLRPGQLIVLESTTYPGTTEEILLPLFEERGLRVGEDFFLAFSPERIDPGNTQYGVHNIPKLVGGMTAACSALATLTYQQIVAQVVAVSSPAVAEASKLLENTFRSVNIALANEMALICEHLKIDVWEVIDAAATKPFGFMPHYPGPGIGGHCIPLDPHYLSWKARLRGYEPKFISLASEINGAMPHRVVSRITHGLNDVSKSVRGSQVLVMGVAYKPNVGDYRESPALEIIEALRGLGAHVSYCDPYVETITTVGNHLMHHQPLTPALLHQSDCVVVVTHHRDFDWQMVVEEAGLVIDTRNATRPWAGLGNVHFL